MSSWKMFGLYILIFIVCGFAGYGVYHIVKPKTIITPPCAEIYGSHSQYEQAVSCPHPKHQLVITVKSTNIGWFEYQCQCTK